MTHSAGNHGQALAWAASAVGLPCTVVVPQTAPSCKTSAIEGYGAKLVKCAPTPVARFVYNYRVYVILTDIKQRLILPDYLPPHSLMFCLQPTSSLTMLPDLVLFYIQRVIDWCEEILQLNVVGVAMRWL